MKRSSIFILVILLSVAIRIQAQVEIIVYNDKPKIIMYSTYEEYVDNKGTEYEYVRAASPNNIILKVNDEQLPFHAKQYWGWKFENVLFRVHKPTNTYAAVVKAGNCVYYETGYGWIRALLNRSGYFYCSEGGLNQYVSETLQSDLYPVRVKDLKTFKLNHSNCAKLADQLINLWKHFTPKNRFTMTIQFIDEFLGDSNTLPPPLVKRI